MKVCSKCHGIWPKGEFYRKPSSKDGLEGQCKDCRKRRFAEIRLERIDRGVDLTIRFKRCPSCEDTLHVQEFAHCRSSYDGYQSYCRTCSSGIDAARESSPSRKATKKRYHSSRRQSWNEYFVELYGERPSCEVCQCSLKWDQVIFDHRHGGTAPIKGKPSNWLRSHWCDDQNIAIWQASDFGVLCNRCNVNLPTKGRLDWLRNALDYAVRSKV